MVLYRVIIEQVLLMRMFVSVQDAFQGFGANIQATIINMMRLRYSMRLMLVTLCTQRSSQVRSRTESHDTNRCHCVEIHTQC